MSRFIRLVGLIVYLTLGWALILYGLYRMVFADDKSDGMIFCWLVLGLLPLTIYVGVKYRGKLVGQTDKNW